MDISVGDTFSSYAELEERLEGYQYTNYVQMWKRDSRTIVTAQKRMPNRHFNPDIKYCELWYSCVHGGRKHVSKSQGQRPHQSTIKADCPFQLKIRCSEDGESLVVTKFISDHNHEVSKKLYNLLPAQKRLDQSDKGVEMLTDKDNEKMICEPHSENTGFYLGSMEDGDEFLRVHSKDLHEHIAQEVGECLESGFYTDLVIRCQDGQTLHGHKLVLSAVSPYLKWLLENNDWEETQTIDIPDANMGEVQLLLEVIYNGSVVATIEELRKLVVMAHRLYISIPLSDELVEGLDVKLPDIPPFKKTPKVGSLLSGLLPSLKQKPSPVKSTNPLMRERKLTASAEGTSSSRPIPTLKKKLHSLAKNGGGCNSKLDASLVTSILASSRNTSHVCPICNTKFNNQGGFKLHMKYHDDDNLKEQRNAVLSEMIATCFNPRTSLYTCHVCNSHYNHSGNFKQHLLKHERESGSISATMMAHASTNANVHLNSALQSAITDRVDKGGDPEDQDKLYKYHCKHCSRTFKHPGNYRQHMLSHSRISGSIGDKKSSDSHGAVVVSRTTSSLKPNSLSSNIQVVTCPECHKEFSSVELLQTHISVSHKHMDVEHPSSSDVKQALSSERVARDVLNQKFKCELCQQGFKTEAFLNQHKVSFHKDEILEAGIDMQGLAGVSGLLGDYDCPFCGKKFLQRSKLNSHIKIHNAPEVHYKYPCDICGKRFTRPQHVNRHKLLHTGEKPFRCPRCSKSFTREDKLKHHVVNCDYISSLAGATSSFDSDIAASLTDDSATSPVVSVSWTTPTVTYDEEEEMAVADSEGTQDEDFVENEDNPVEAETDKEEEGAENEGIPGEVMDESDESMEEVGATLMSTPDSSIEQEPE